MSARILPILTLTTLGLLLVGLPALALLDTAGLDPARLLLMAALAAPVAAFIVWSLAQPVTHVPVTVAARERQTRR